MASAHFSLGIFLGAGPHPQHASFYLDAGTQRGEYFIRTAGQVMTVERAVHSASEYETKCKAAYIGPSATLRFLPAATFNWHRLLIMPARVSETYVLRTYPFRESDLIVSFFTRDQGKLRGVARRARKPKSSFGSGLERLSLVNLSYSQKETRELVNLNSCDLVQSQFNLLTDFDATVTLDYLAEVSDHLLPANEPNERFFRLLATVLDHMHERTPGAIWASITYFSLWATRLSGFLPDLTKIPERSLSASSRELSKAMLCSHITDLPPLTWTKDTAMDLRRFLIRQMEEHVERRFHTPAMLEAL